MGPGWKSAMDAGKVNAAVFGFYNNFAQADSWHFTLLWLASSIASTKTQIN